MNLSLGRVGLFGSKLIKEIDVESDTQTLNITGLNINSDLFYRLVCNLACTAAAFKWYINNDSSNNYSNMGITYTAVDQYPSVFTWLPEPPVSYPAYATSLTSNVVFIIDIFKLVDSRVLMYSTVISSTPPTETEQYPMGYEEWITITSVTHENVTSVHIETVALSEEETPIINSGSKVLVYAGR